MRKIFFLLVATVLAFALGGCEGDMIPTAPDKPVLVNPVVDLFSNPLGAEAEIYRLNMSKSDDPFGTEVFSGTTPVVGLRLEPGSYIARFSAEAYDSKVLGLRLAYGDTNVSETVDLTLSPVDPPEPEPVTGYLTFSENPITLGETVGVTPTMYNGVLGILSMGGETHFVYSGAYTFPFKPLTAGEHFVSFLGIGEGGDYLPINAVLTVLPGDPEEVTLNAWIVGSDTVPADGRGYFAWAASANVDSVTTNGYYTDGNIGISGESHVVVIQDMVLELYAWKDGEIRDAKTLRFYVQPPEPMPLPELTFYASAYEVESSNPAWTEYQVVEGQEVWLIWNVKFYDEASDEVWLDRQPTYGDLGPRGLMPVTVSSDTTFTLGVDRNGQEAISKMVHITVTDGPIEQPDYIDLSWHTNVWVGQRNQDPHQVDLMSGIRLPANTSIDVWARLEYSPEDDNQDDESCALGFLTDSSEYWAYLDDPDCPVFPDQGEDIDQVFFIGSVSGFSEMDGRMVMRTGTDFDCQGAARKCYNPNSVHLSEVKLRVYLR